MTKHENAQVVADVGSPLEPTVRPCGWRWLDSWIYRKKVPSYSTPSEWGPVYDQQALEAALDAERERCAVVVDAYLQDRIGCTYGAGDAVRRALAALKAVDNAERRG